MIEALDIQVKGIVQGVGFRPFVYRMAKKYLINGWVLNAADGVFIHGEGEAKLLDEFVIELSENPPAASRVSEITLKEVPLENFESFDIRFSDAGAVEKTTLVSPDLATCKDCEQELFNPNDRRFRYPFINCTNCGPRFTIIDGLPYDRKKTSMKHFPMCERCEAEYADPLDRRFHAQPDACFECGPHVSWREHQGGTIDAALVETTWGMTREESDAIVARAVELLLAGGVLAVKGLGGFHLVCDAENEEAVRTLRVRKRREGKAFAVMMESAGAARGVCEVSDAEVAALSATQRPIVLLRKLSQATFVSGLADGLSELGVMLPYTPVQQLLLHDFIEAGGSGMLVMTSGNLHDEPIVTDDAQAYEKLFALADGFLGHDRAIRARYDDSVVRIIRAGSAGDALQFIRRARGFAPLPIALACLPTKDVEVLATAEGLARATEPASCSTCLPSVFATGPEQKNTFTLVREREAFVSQHMGDMENAETYDAWLAAKARYEELFQIDPQLVACDMHPEYLTSKWAHEQQLPVVEVQHHHAHIVSVMAEHGLQDAVCGIAFDGTGYGVDGALWGGEVLMCNLTDFERFANFAYVPMPGGAAAVKNPLRMAYGALWAFDLLDHPGAGDALAALGSQAEICEQMIERGINTPMTSSVGRLFDAASALLGVCPQPSYEGEPAILLEAAMGSFGGGDGGVSQLVSSSGLHDAAGGDSCVVAKPCANLALEPCANPALSSELPAETRERYAISLVKNTANAQSTAQDTSVLLFDAAPTFKALLDDKVSGVPTSLIAECFHDAFVGAIVDAAQLVRSVYDVSTVALSGGVFMNRYLVENALAALENAGFTAAINRDLPPGDGCISLGQAVVACASGNHRASGIDA